MKISSKRFPAIFSLLLLLCTSIYGQKDISESWEKALNERQPPEIVIKSIGVRKGMTIGEIGAGRGRYTVFLAKATGDSGKVIANDLDEASLSFLRGRCRRLGINNVETVVGEPDNPLFPNNALDMAIMVLVYHMIDNPDNLMKNLKPSLKSGARLVILDPDDEEIDREFGIDRSGEGSKAPTIIERIQKSACTSGYEIVRVETFLPHDYIFILAPQIIVPKRSAGELIRKSMLSDGIDGAIVMFNTIKNDPGQFDLSEQVFTNLGYEFIGSRSYPEAVTVLKMGNELFPESSKIYGEIGEVYLLKGEKEKARLYYKLYLEHGPDSLNTGAFMQNFDAIYEQMHPNN
jgi:ubiquinone/menaquinone biosynthesis C-methylase UbiE